MNHDGYEQRIGAVRNILQCYGLEATDIAPLEYSESCPFPYNNFIYKVNLTRHATKVHFAGNHNQPCTILPPEDGVPMLVVRLSNPKAQGMNPLADRVGNEVAAIHLLRKSIEKGPLEVVPAVYAWKSASKPINDSKAPGEAIAESDFGWTMMEYVAGKSLDAVFGEFSPEEKNSVISQAAAIFAAVQKAPLPIDSDRHGGWTIDDKGGIISAESSLVKGGCTKDYVEFWKAKFNWQLESGPDTSQILAGWRANGLRERIDAFIATRVEQLLHEHCVDVSQRVLIHGDFTMNNMLVDPGTKRITGLLDYDWSFVSHPAEIFLMSLWCLGGNPGAAESDRTRRAILTGSFDDAPKGAAGAEGSGEEKEQWQTAKAWDEALQKHGATRPCDIKGMELLVEMQGFLDMLYPFPFVHALTKKTPEEIVALRAEKEAALVSTLGKFGA